jgi:hypothetical protein
MAQDPDTPPKDILEMSRDDQIVFWVLIFVVVLTTFN